MFDPPYKGRISIAGVPIVTFSIPRSETKYKDFLDWWLKVGRLKPNDPQGWSTLSGPGCASGNMEAISAKDWEALPDSERARIRAWAINLPCGMFYD